MTTVPTTTELPTDSRPSFARALFTALRRWLLVLAACLVFTVLEALQGRVRYGAVPWGEYWAPALRRTLGSWVALALLVPPVVAWARAFRVQRHSPAVTVLAHAFGGAVFLALHLWVSALTVRWAFPRRSVLEQWNHFVYTYATMDLFIYFAIVGFVQMYLALSEIRASERRSLELQASLSRAELARLRSQIDPHFLFNSLNSVAALADQQDLGRVRGAVATLSSLLRRSMDTVGEQEVALEEELKFVRDYFSLQQLRFGDRLTVSLEASSDAGGLRVPSLLLQPLIENAVRYGIEHQPGAGMVSVRIRREGATLVVRVENSGPGFGAGAGASGQGIGLENTRQRLRQLYGDAQSLTVGDRPEGGAFVEVRLPAADAGQTAPPAAGGRRS